MRSGLGTAFSAPAIYAQLNDAFPVPEAQLQVLFARDCHDCVEEGA